jgi:hypothetical protein
VTGAKPSQQGGRPSAPRGNTAHASRRFFSRSHPASCRAWPHESPRADQRARRDAPAAATAPPGRGMPPAGWPGGWVWCGCAGRTS